MMEILNIDLLGTELIRAIGRPKQGGSEFFQVAELNRE
jgi:hypothetical protein